MGSQYVCRNQIDEYEVLNQVNSLLEEEYSNFDNILSLNGKYDYSSIKKGFKEKIFKAKTDKERIQINLAFEYFISDPNNIANYNSYDKSQLKKFTEFNPTMFIITKKLEIYRLQLFKKILDKKKFMKKLKSRKK